MITLKRQILAISLFSFLISFSAYAKIPLIFTLSPQNLRLAYLNPPNVQAPQDSETPDHEKPQIDMGLVILKNSLINALDNREVNPKAFKEYLEQNKASLEKTYIPQIQAYIESIAQRHQTAIHKEGSTKFFSIADGVSFYKEIFEFKNIKDPLFKAITLALIDSHQRAELSSSQAEKILIKIKEKAIAETYLLPPNQYSEQDLKDILNFASDKNYRYEKIGSTWILGSGFSYLLMRENLLKGQELTDPVLKSKFEKVVRYHQSFNIPVTHEYYQSANAYFVPSEKRITYSLPGSGDIGVYTHEMTHSRFQKFTETLDSWTAAKNYQIPYQIEGPLIGRMSLKDKPHGGIFNLLNEVNSWRIGESYDGPVSDDKILKILARSYGPQAGYESTDLLLKVWNAEKLKGKAIPYLIYSEIKAFNQLTNDQLVMMGYEGVEESDVVKKINFATMYLAGRFKNTPEEQDADFVLDEIKKTAKEKSLLGFLEKIENKPVPTKTVQAAKQASATQQQADVKQTFTIEQIVENFRQGGNLLLMMEAEHLKSIGTEHIDAIVERSTQAKQYAYRHEGVAVLEYIFKGEKITKLLQRDAKEQAVLRSPMQHKFIEALDESLSRRLYDGSVPSKKMDLVNYLSENLYPEELPKTYAKTLELLKAIPTNNPSDAWLARIFLSPSTYSKSGEGFAWGEALIRDIRGVPTGEAVRDTVAIYYKEVLSPYLSLDSQYGVYGESRLDQKTKVLAQREMAQLSDQQKESLIRASRTLWNLMGDPSPTVRTSALYAMMSNTLYILQNEGRLTRALLTKKEHYTEAAKLLLDVAPEMLPTANRIYQNQQEKLSLSPQQMVCNKVLLKN
jgi:hypothetical protein